MSARAPILYSFRRCPYAMRARMALQAARITCELREVALARKPDQMLEASPKGSVPVLVLPSGRVIDESLEIMEWALSGNDPHRWREVQPAQAALWLWLIDGQFKHHLDRYKYADRYEGADAETHREGGLKLLERMEAAIAERGFLAAARETYVDIAAFPFVRQFANTDRAWFDAQPLPRLQGWLAAFLGDPRFASVMVKYKPWEAGETGPLVFSRGSDHTSALAAGSGPSGRIGV
ncbi:MAG: glutathione S-transferase [Pseudomonadota bacterium]